MRTAQELNTSPRMAIRAESINISKRHHIYFRKMVCPGSRSERLYVDKANIPLNGQYKAILSIDDEFRIGPAAFGGHHEIAAFSTMRKANAVKSAGSFYFKNGKVTKADLRSGHFEPKPFEGYANLLEAAARKNGYKGPSIMELY